MYWKINEEISAHNKYPNHSYRLPCYTCSPGTESYRRHQYITSFFKRGMFKDRCEHFDYTLNEKKLSDYYALAAGAGISYHTPEWKGLSAGLSGFVIFNLVSSDLDKPDPLSQQKDRYEIGLFDITDPLNKYNLSRMEELYLKYQFKAVQATVGRQFIKTPFINKQDGRMRRP